MTKKELTDLINKMLEAKAAEAELRASTKVVQFNYADDLIWREIHRLRDVAIEAGDKIVEMVGGDE
jgi:hypothetical protein